MSDLLSIQEVSVELKVSQQHVRTLCREEKLKSEKVGKQWVISKKSLTHYIEKFDVVIEPDDHPRLSNDIPDIVALSFFTGAMGLDIGLEKEGIEAVLASEIDKETRKTIQANKPDIALIGDISNYTAEQILEYANLPEKTKIDLMFGGPPCQAFSTAGKRRGFEDDRGNVFLKFIHLIGEIKPTYALIENVRGLYSAKYPIQEGGEPIKGGALFYVVKTLEQYGYSVSFELYNSANFGAPQTRERVVLICKLGAEKVPHLIPTHSNNPDDDLHPWVTLGETIKKLKTDKTNYVDFPEKRLQYFRILKEGQNWRDLPKDIQADAMGKSYNLGGGKTGFYRRLSYSKPSPTLVTHPAMPATDLCHPVENRPLSTEEYRVIQGFPDQWRFCGKITDIYRQIGNAVPIELARAAARAIIADKKNTPFNEMEYFKHSRYKDTDEVSFMNKIQNMFSI